MNINLVNSVLNSTCRDDIKSLEKNDFTDLHTFVICLFPLFNCCWSSAFWSVTNFFLSVVPCSLMLVDFAIEKFKHTWTYDCEYFDLCSTKYYSTYKKIFMLKNVTNFIATLGTHLVSTHLKIFITVIIHLNVIILKFS